MKISYNRQNEDFNQNIPQWKEQFQIWKTGESFETLLRVPIGGLFNPQQAGELFYSKRQLKSSTTKKDHLNQSWINCSFISLMRNDDFPVS
jgi:hypothetical protein